MSSDKTATERLRELLDERGVEWWYGIGEKSTVFDGEHDVRYEVDGTLGLLFIRSALDVTPEQAIAATLGNERTAFLEEKVKRQGEYIDKLTKEKKALFAQNCESATRHAGQIDAMQKKLDAATMGAGTCRDLADTPQYGDKTRFECSECGYEYNAVGGFGCDYGDEPDFRFCPNCGRKVVGE